jgi:soluble lytic murein transglycosylase
MPSRSLVSSAAALTGFAVGLSFSTLSSTELRIRADGTPAAEPVHTLPPVLAVHRETLGSAVLQAELYLATGRPWAAWRQLEPHLNSADVTVASVLLAARAAAGWGGWAEVRSLLVGRQWLAHVQGGEGLLLLAEAYEHTARNTEAAETYRRYLDLVAAAPERAVAHGRLARVLAASGRYVEAAEAYRQTAEALPPVADWLAVLEMESWLASEAAHAVPVSGSFPAGSEAARMRRARAATQLLLARQDTAAAVARLGQEIRILTQQAAFHEAAELTFELARLEADAGHTAESRELLRALAWEHSLPAGVRVRSANVLGEKPSLLTLSDELARAAAYEAGRRWQPAARSLRAALAAGAPSTPAAQLRFGRLLFEAGDFRAARDALLSARDGLAAAEEQALAELLAARARFRSGDRAGGLDEIRRVAERWPSTAAAGTALFLLADAAPRVEDAIPLYRRAASIEHAPEAREALERLADRIARARSADAAFPVWQEYVRRYPRGEATARLAFQLALESQRAGRRSQAEFMYRASIAADPLSYYAVRAGERLGRDPLDRVLSVPRPWIGLAVDPIDATAALERLDLLRELGLTNEWNAELQATVRRFQRRPAALLAVAEGLRDGGQSVEAIRLSRRLLELRDGEWDERLLRVAFPLPYRELLLAEAARHEVDPMLFAALVHQESAFRPAVRSRVGATGLAQIMPATGRWLAARVDIQPTQYEDRLLTVPEVNLRMGALFLRDLMVRYGGAADLALAGYNAGPGRADRWRRELGHDRDVDRFRDAIPFHETRHYVQIVLRNALVYDRLYRTTADRLPPPIDELPAAAE